MLAFLLREGFSYVASIIYSREGTSRTGMTSILCCLKKASHDLDLFPYEQINCLDTSRQLNNQKLSLRFGFHHMIQTPADGTSKFLIAQLILIINAIC